MKKESARRITMKKQILYSVLLVTAITAAVLMLVNRVTLYRSTMNTALDNYNEISRLSGSYLDEAIKNVESGINRIVFTGDFQEVLVEYEEEKEAGQELAALASNVQNELADTVVISNLYSGIISNIVVFDTDGAYIASMRPYSSTADLTLAYQEAADARSGRMMWVETHRDAADTYLQYANVVSVVKKIYSTNLSSDNSMYGQGIGYVLINIDEKKFQALYQDMIYGETGRMWVINGEHVIVSAEDKEQLGETLDERLIGEIGTASQRRIDGERTIISNYYNQSSGWYLVSSVSSDELMMTAKNQTMNSCIIAAAMFALVLFVMYQLSMWITRPLTELQQEMKKVEKGDFSIQLQSQSNVAEIQDFISGFQVMIRRLDELMREVYEAGKKERELQLTVTQSKLAILQNQMNPHFLYNTLDSIGWMAMLGGQSELSRMVNNLGDILRATVKMDSFTSAVRSNLELLNKYLHIQKVRYGDRLHVSIESEEAAQDCQMLKWMLQPFVENAIVHGMRETGEPLRIRVRIGLTDTATTGAAEESKAAVSVENTAAAKNTAVGGSHMLLAVVEDDGRGMDGQTASQLFAEKEETGRHTGIGCNTVYQLLCLVYGEHFLCEVESRPGQGSRITVKTPVSGATAEKTEQEQL